MCATRQSFIFFFFNDTATTEIYTLSLHDALPICGVPATGRRALAARGWRVGAHREPVRAGARGRLGRGELERSEEHTSELQSHLNLVCRLLLEKKKMRYEARHLQQVCVHMPMLGR